MATAILIDGGYFIKRFRALEPHNAYNAERVADCVFRWAVAHLSEGRRGGLAHRHDLYRIFFYDCPPIMKKLRNPVSDRTVDFSKSPEAVFRRELHDRLLCKRKMALRLGNLSGSGWTIKQHKIDALLNHECDLASLLPEDVVPAIRQKGVDMRIGVDVAALAFKRQMDQIVLFAGDADFVPAAKLARREGMDFVLDPMRRDVSKELLEHIDGLRSTCPSRQPVDRRA